MHEDKGTSEPTHRSVRQTAMFRTTGRVDGYAILAGQAADRITATVAAKTDSKAVVKRLGNAAKIANPREREQAVIAIAKRENARQRFIANATAVRHAGHNF
jgi:hypothetical protein